MSVSSANPDSARDFVDRTGASFPIGFDLSESYLPLRASAPGRSSNSLHLILDRDGTLAYFSQEYDEAAMLEVLDRLAD